MASTILPNQPDSRFCMTEHEFHTLWHLWGAIDALSGQLHEENSLHEVFWLISRPLGDIITRMTNDGATIPGQPKVKGGDE